MKFYFFDTSALVKRYHYENGTEKVDSIFSEDDRAIIISSISITEIVSALNRKKGEGVIAEDDLQFTISKFFHDAIKEFTVLEISEENVKDSIELVLSENLRTLDALQLAVALGLKDLEAIFVCADKNLINAAKSIGLNVVNPED